MGGNLGIGKEYRGKGGSGEVWVLIPSLARGHSGGIRPTALKRRPMTSSGRDKICTYTYLECNGRRDIPGFEGEGGLGGGGGGGSGDMKLQLHSKGWSLMKVVIRGRRGKKNKGWDQ